ncbi:MAG: cupin domain-containing protein [Rhodobacteraceae bacterium]|nr:MAG: cupin domain-containing protein [Paracoccaceae bacterium]
MSSLPATGPCARRMRAHRTPRARKAPAMQDDALFPLLSALAAVYAAEPREEAGRTARHLLEAGPSHLGAAHANDAILAEMAAALAASDHPAVQAILAGAHLLPWGDNPVAAQAAAAGDIYVVCTLMGPDGPIPSDDFRMGLFWQRPGTYYALHSHDADETYVIVAGDAEWTAGDDTRLRGPGEAIHHPSLMPHAFRAGPQGLLALWRWSGDVNTHSYRMLPDPRAVAAA